LTKEKKNTCGYLLLESITLWRVNEQYVHIPVILQE